MGKIIFLLCLLGLVIGPQNVAASTINNIWNGSTVVGQIQVHDGSNGGFWGFGQTFTLQLGDDNQLDDMHVWLSANGSHPSTLNWALYSGNTMEATNLIADIDIPLVGGWYEFNQYTIDVGGQLLNIGQEYSWWITAVTGVASVGTNGGYADGHLSGADNLSVGTYYNWPNDDLAFVMNLSETANVPIPSTLLLMCSGFLGLLCIRSTIENS